MTAEHAKRVAQEALKRGGDPNLARRILESALAGREGGRVLERRLEALLDTVPEEEDRLYLARIAWGPGAE
jgi:hypothetical protein